MRKIVVLNRTGDDYSCEKNALSQFPDVEFVVSPAYAEEEVIREVKDAEVILFTDVPMTQRVISSLEKCRLIIRYGIGYDNVDLKCAAQKNIFVCNAPRYGTIDVAEHTVCLLLAVAKQLRVMGERISEGQWGPGDAGAFPRLQGKTVGFVGFGGIGQEVCRRTNAFGMKAVVYDPFAKQEVLEQLGAQSVSLDELLAAADFVTLHLPLNETTRHMFDRALFAKMKSSAILINTSRGPIVCQEDLIDALKNNVIAGAGLDVFENETEPLDSRLATIPRTVLTPHVAWNTDMAIVSLHREVSDNLVRYLSGQRPESIVNGL